MYRPNGMLKCTKKPWIVLSKPWAGLVHFDISPVENSSIKDLSVTKLASYFKKAYGLILEEEETLTLLKNTSILNELDDALCASVGGLLLFSDFPYSSSALPHNRCLSVVLLSLIYNASRKTR